MKSQIRTSVRRCEICQAAKHSNLNKKEYQKRLFAGRPWHVLSVDLVGPFSRTPRGNNDSGIIGPFYQMARCHCYQRWHHSIYCGGFRKTCFLLLWSTRKDPHRQRRSFRVSIDERAMQGLGSKQKQNYTMTPRR